MQSSNSSTSRSISVSSADEEMPVARLNDDYDLIKVIGKGSTAKVWLARYVEDPSIQFAIKIMSAQYMKNKKSAAYVKKEVEILSKLDHQGVIQLYEYSNDGNITYGDKVYKGQTYIVMEYVEGPLLFDLVK
jgi:serine/threonine protein kinase